MSEPGVDNSEHLLRAMDKYGVTHAIIQIAPGVGIRNQIVLDAAQKSGGRFFPIYRPEAVSVAAAKGTLGVDYGDEVSKVTRQIADELLSPAMSAVAVMFSVLLPALIALRDTRRAGASWHEDRHGAAVETNAPINYV